MKIKRLFLAIAMLVISLNMTVFAEERRPLGENETRPRLSAINEDHLLIKNAWYHRYDGAWIYLDDEGRALQNTWFQDPANEKWYYFDEYCYMLHDTATPDGFYVGADGAWVTETQTTSPWLGTYKADDDQVITVKSVDDKGIQVSLYGYNEEGWNTREYSVQFTDTEKKKAVYVISEHYKEVYTLTDTGIEITIEPAGGWAQGIYVKQK